MKFATFKKNDGTSAIGIVHDGQLLEVSSHLEKADLPSSDVGAILAADAYAALREAGRSAIDEPETADAAFDVESVDLLPPIMRPSKILCVAANYRAHIEETKVITYAPKEEASPWFFQKPLSSLNPHKSPIRLPRLSKKVDWEVELGLVIGREGHDIPAEEAFDYIAGYTVIIDISAREIDIPHRTQIRDRDKFHDWLHGKWFDTFCCVGPWMISQDELGKAEKTRLQLEVSGKLYQDADTSLMIFSIGDLIAFISQVVTLKPGDLIATGTPSGVGKASGRFLQNGDLVRATIDGIGTLEHPVVGSD